MNIACIAHLLVLLTYLNQHHSSHTFQHMTKHTTNRYKWKSTFENRLRSAYQVANGQEPEFTNHAWTSGMPEPFTDTLDYIWISDHWDVESVMDLPNRESLMNIKSYPTESEPSDHVMIGANLQRRVI